MKKIILCLVTLFLVTTIFSQKRNESGAYYDYNVRCLGKEMDGSLTLEAYGKGRNYWDAAEQAKKNAVHAVLFKGIKDGNGGCSRDPLFFNPNTEILNEDYFAAFFTDGGGFLDFVNLKDERISRKIKRNSKKSKQMQQRMVVVRVDRIGLKKKLQSDNIK